MFWPALPAFVPGVLRLEGGSAFVLGVARESRQQIVAEFFA